VHGRALKRALKQAAIAKAEGIVEATSGFEPLNRGFADLRVEPLHHVASWSRQIVPQGPWSAGPRRMTGAQLQVRLSRSGLVGATTSSKSADVNASNAPPR
jgi:hypothetical protein